MPLLIIKKETNQNKNQNFYMKKSLNIVLHIYNIKKNMYISEVCQKKY